VLSLLIPDFESPIAVESFNVPWNGTTALLLLFCNFLIEEDNYVEFAPSACDPLHLTALFNDVLTPDL